NSSPVDLISSSFFLYAARFFYVLNSVPFYFHLKLFYYEKVCSFKHPVIWSSLSFTQEPDHLHDPLLSPPPLLWIASLTHGMALVFILMEIIGF
ncbi:MAG: hypothetical protein RBS33_14835, partial [Lentimicrobium sp.]|nr:hypothetical protein [Lentimicrobium sp.]